MEVDPWLDSSIKQRIVKKDNNYAFLTRDEDLKGELINKNEGRDETIEATVWILWSSLPICLVSSYTAFWNHPCFLVVVATCSSCHRDNRHLDTGLLVFHAHF